MGILETLDKTIPPQGHLHWPGREEALMLQKFKVDPPSPPTLISPTSTVKQALEFQVFLNQEHTSVPYALLLVPYTTMGKSQSGPQSTESSE